MKPSIYGQKSSGGGGLKLSRILLNVAHPVGSIIQTTKTQAQFDPNTMLGGTWRLLRGVFLFGAKADSVITGNVLDGGEETHRLIAPEMPSHSHNPYMTWLNNNTHKHNDMGGYFAEGITGGGKYTGGANFMAAAGGNVPHNNMPPYKNVNIWERTA